MVWGKTLLRTDCLIVAASALYLEFGAVRLREELPYDSCRLLKKAKFSAKANAFIDPGKSPDYIATVPSCDAMITFFPP